MRNLAAAAGLGALVVVGLVGAPTPAGAVETCHGQPATIGPTGDEVVTGTPGPDVIVVQAAAYELAPEGTRFVQAGDGDDLICVLGGTTYVDAGPGDDTLDASGVTDRVVTTLGLGDDHFVGGPGNDVVDDGPSPSQGADFEAQDGTDVIDSRGGDDNIDLSEFGEPRPDIVDSGPGSDAIKLHGFDLGTMLDFGTGRRDSLWFRDGSAPTSEIWRVDNHTRTLTRGDVSWTWNGHIDWYVFDLRSDPAPARLTFVGSDRDELLSLEMPPGRTFPVTARMGGGDDLLEGSWGDQPSQLTLLGGHGEDRLAFSPGVARVHLDLLRGRVDYGSDGGHGIVASFEDVQMEARHIRIRGSRSSETFTINACTGGVAAGPGNDKIVLRSYGTCDVRHYWAYGGSGNDRINSARSDDLLVGGLGFDRVNGRGGFDTCRAEVVRLCER
jgi:Ca2+-binding RTX toxin-like protein